MSEQQKHEAKQAAPTLDAALFEQVTERATASLLQNLSRLAEHRAEIDHALSVITARIVSAAT